VAPLIPTRLQRHKTPWLSQDIFAVFIVGLATNLMWAAPALGMAKDDDIDTNRPSFMDSPLVVPRGSLQFENGGLYQHFQHGLNYYDASETEVRLGLTKGTEFQMFVPNWELLHSRQSASAGISNTSPSFAVFQSTQANTRSGVSDLGEIGIKQQLRPILKDLNVSVIAGLNAPTGNRFISGTGVQPVVRVPFTKQLTKNVSYGGMQSLLVINSGRDVQWQNFWLVSRAIGKRSSLFIEYAGFFTHHATASNIIHFGAVRKVNKNMQVDVQFGFGLDQTAPAAFVGAGYSLRLDRLPLIESL